MQKGIKGSDGGEEGFKVHQEEEKEDEMEDFECQDKESSRSGKSNRYNTIKNNNIPGYSRTELRRHESTGRKGPRSFKILQNGKEEKQHSRKRDLYEQRHIDSDNDYYYHSACQALC